MQLAASEQSQNKRVHQSTHQQCSFTRLAVIHCTSRWTENRSIWISEWTSLKSYEYTVTYNNGLPDLSTGAQRTLPRSLDHEGAERRIQFSRALNRWCSSWRCPHGAAVHRHSPGDTPTPLPHQRGPFRLWSMSAGSPASRVFFRCAPSILFRFCVLFQARFVVLAIRTASTVPRAIEIWDSMGSPLFLRACSMPIACVLLSYCLLLSAEQVHPQRRCHLTHSLLHQLGSNSHFCMHNVRASLSYSKRK